MKCTPHRFGRFHQKIAALFQFKSWEKSIKIRRFYENRAYQKQKTTVIYFDEHSRIIEVQTHNTDLKKRLAAFAAKHPQCCRQTDDDEQGGLTFEIEKRRLSFRLTAPYSEERRRAASEWANRNLSIKPVNTQESKLASRGASRKSTDTS